MKNFLLSRALPELVQVTAEERLCLIAGIEVRIVGLACVTVVLYDVLAPASAFCITCKK